MKKNNWIYLAMTSAILLQGCAESNLNKKVDNEVAQETSVNTHADLRAESGQLIQSAPGLTDEQRKKLMSLRDSTRSQVDDMWSQSLKLKSILIKDLITTNYNEDEVELVKQRIKTLEDKRLSVEFVAAKKATEILGHYSTENHQVIMREFFGIPHSKD